MIDPARNGRRKATRGAALDRVAFRTSRALDYFSERELTAQTGHGPEWWPEVILKELLDNAIDAAEQAGTAPALAYGFLNPHLGVALRTPNAEDDVRLKPTNPAWSKWLPTTPTSPHWYTVADLADLIAANISNGHGERTVRAFVAEFAGLSSSARTISSSGAQSSGVCPRGTSAFAAAPRMGCPTLSRRHLRTSLVAMDG